MKASLKKVKHIKPASEIGDPLAGFHYGINSCKNIVSLLFVKWPELNAALNKFNVVVAGLIQNQLTFKTTST